MAKEIAIGKRAKISQAQQYMLLSVLGASIFLGVGLSLSMHFINQISFNAKVIAEEEKSIVAYSDVIKKTGICKSPNGTIYSDEELKNCNPDNINVSEIPGTLRSNILEGLAASEALNSVPKESSLNCRNANGQPYTYKELNEILNNASPAERSEASQLIKRCSALRVIPDALPAYRNEEALLASLNNIFNISNWEPESISPSDEAYNNSSEESGEVLEGPSANTISVQLTIEDADAGITTAVLNNLERSIRDFNVNQATIEWGSANSLSLSARATAYYVDNSTISETTKTVNPGDNATGAKQ